MIDKIQDAPTTYEALIDDPLHALVVGTIFPAFKKKQQPTSPE